MAHLLEVKNLKVVFHGENNSKVTAVDDISYKLNEGETLGIVGESGCGKSVGALSIMQLVPCPPGEIESGEILFEGENLLNYDAEQIRNIRGNKISMIFQEPMTSLNPVYTIGRQMMEGFIQHRNMNKSEAFEASVNMLEKVGISEPRNRMSSYPHELSGGMRQRVMIAMALSFQPKILIADEPTTALDVTIQAQIMELIKKLQTDLGMSVVLITHDMGVVAESCDYVIVKYAGQIVESAPVNDIFAHPLHPYTEGLLRSIPKIGDASSNAKFNEDGIKVKERLESIPGVVPDIANLPKGCRFAERCKYAQDKCKDNNPSLSDFDKKRRVACYFPLSPKGGDAS